MAPDSQPASSSSPSSESILTACSTNATEARHSLYKERRELYESREHDLERRSHRLSNIRGITFVAALVSSIVAVFGDSDTWAPALAVVGTAAFAAAVFRHGRLLERLDETRRWVQVNRDAELRVSPDWLKLPIVDERFSKAPHPYADDLDIFGEGSVFQKICVAHTRYGQNKLAEMLSSPASISEIRERQAVVGALRDQLEWRQRLEAQAIALGEKRSMLGSGRQKPPSERPPPPDPEPFLRWVEQPPSLWPKRVIRTLAWALPIATLSSLVLSLFSIIPLTICAIPICVQILVLFRVGLHLNQTFGAVTTTQGNFVRYGAMLKMLEMLDFDAPKLVKLRTSLTQAGTSPSLAMGRFRRSMSWFELRHNGLIHPIANVMLLWDLHCVLALEKWKANVGSVARSWFDAIGEIEALSCISGLSHDEPTFCMPTVVEGPPQFVAEGLAHPLLQASQRISNDVDLIEPGQALLITGSNMSGKSTLLRAMGLAAVLAYAGAPVCARRLQLSEAMVRTSIRVRDSLQSGVSHFYAEIEKLKQVVDAALSSKPVLFLLDEILHGTNSTERQTGARWVLAELVRHNAIGAVSTHDIELCQLSAELMDRVQQVHFQESTRDGRMHFDYALRSGPVRAGNALRLMRLLGLNVPAPQMKPPE